MERILLVDDDHVFRELLKRALENEGYQIIVAENTWEAKDIAGADQFTFILFDLAIHHIDEFRLLLQSLERVPIVAMSILDNEDERIKGYELGADDFLTKPFSMKELLVRMNTIRRRVNLSQYRPAKTSNYSIAIEFDETNYLVQIHEQEINLTQTEFRVFKYLYERRGKVVTKQELQRSILQKDLGQFDRNLDMHISNTRKKLANTILQRSAINTVRGQGYSFGSV